eukprot:6195251-Prymnesium_polylepis.1
MLPKPSAECTVRQCRACGQRRAATRVPHFPRGVWQCARRRPRHHGALRGVVHGASQLAVLVQRGAQRRVREQAVRCARKCATGTADADERPPLVL